MQNSSTVHPGAIAPPVLRPGSPAPVFTARTTQGERSLASYRGRWLLLFFHPANFTPVCTSEFVQLARRAADFEAVGCALLGISADSVYAHVAWLLDLKQRFGAEIGFPLVEDTGLRIAAAYGLLDESAGDTRTVRACFVLDPEGVVRAMHWYPPDVGRNVEELLRLVTALIHSARERASAPAGWVPGQALLTGAPDTLAAAEQIHSDHAWYYQERQP